MTFVLPRGALTNSVTIKRAGSGNTILVFAAGCTGGVCRIFCDGTNWRGMGHEGSSVTLGTDY